MKNYPPVRDEYRGRINRVRDNGCGFEIGDIVIAEPSIYTEGEVSIRPDNRLGPTLICVPEKFIDRMSLIHKPKYDRRHHA